ncbi:enolase-like [Papaver somniferum]|uniref:enolase-like n=1 Tax=Papaver somniferum TaxID=3469 RepID=UPI000E701B6E|nr:enolase-like [Papaver somniferum]
MEGGTSKYSCFAARETKDGLKLLKTVIAKAGYTGKVHMLFGMDVAAPELYAETEKTHNMNLERCRWGKTICCFSRD